MNDPILSRSMFQQSPSMAAPSMPATGIGGMTTPDQNAMALRNMFAPQAYKRGGEVIDGVAHFADGNEVVAPPASSQFMRDVSAPMPTLNPNATDPETLRVMRDREEILRRRKGIEEAGQKFQELQKTPSPPSYFESMPEPTYRQRTEESFAPLREAQRAAESRVGAEPQNSAAAAEDRLRAAGLANLTPDIVASMEDKDRHDVMRPGGMYNVGETPRVPPPNPKDESIQTNLEAIKARREASDKQREQNKWMGIMAAGLGMMASKSPHFATGVGEGGLQGLQTYAGLEKARREEETNLRHEDYQKQQLDLQKQQMGQQLDIAKMQLAKDPDNVRLIKQIGGGDFNRGYDIYKREEAVKSAKSIMDAPLGTPGVTDADREWAVRTIRSATGSRTGSSGWSGQLVSPAPSGTR